MFEHKYTKRIRYNETDQMGYFYYGNYAQLYEIGRVEAIRSLGLTYKVLEEDLKIMMPVLYTESRYKGPILYDELITINTLLNEMPTKLIRFDHKIYNEGQELIHTGMVKLFFIDMRTNKRISAPTYLTEKLKFFF